MSSDFSLPQLPDLIAQAENLPSPPSVAMEVLRLTGDETVSIDDIAVVVSRDPALSAKILKLSNSSLFKRGSDVTTLDRATMVLGLKTVKLMALSFSLAGTLPRSGDDGSLFDYDAYWAHSLTMAVAGRSLAKLVKSRYFDEAFMCGLLSHIGQLVMAECMPDDYAKVLSRIAGGMPGAEDERQVLGFDFPAVGASLLHSWDMPEQIYLSIYHAAAPGELPATASVAVQELSWIMNLAELASTIICTSRKGPALQDLHNVMAQRFEITDSEIDAFIIGLENGVSETAALLNIELPESQSFAQIIEQARMQMVNVSLGTAVDLAASQQREASLRQEKADLSEKANTDKLTGIRNRAFFDDKLKEVIGQHINGKAKKPLGIMVLDIDHFKKFNDTHGHLAGDEVLKAVANAVDDAVRGDDVAARYGGEEFVVILPETDAEGLKMVAESIRQSVEETEVRFEDKALRVTASIGGALCASIDRQSDGPALLKIADECLYQAKDNGRNQCVTTSVSSCLA